MAAVLSVAFSPDGKRVVTASDDNTARLWDAGTGTEAAVLKGHTGTVLSAAFSPDGQRVVTASQDKTTRLWDATSATLLQTLEGHNQSLDAGLDPKRAPGTDCMKIEIAP